MSGEDSYDNDISECTQCIATQIFYFRSSKYQYWLWFSKSTTISVWIKKINHATSPLLRSVLENVQMNFRKLRVNPLGRRASNR